MSLVRARTRTTRSGVEGTNREATHCYCEWNTWRTVVFIEHIIQRIKLFISYLGYLRSIEISMILLNKNVCIKSRKEEPRRKARNVYNSNKEAKTTSFSWSQRVFELTCASVFLALVDFVTILTASSYCLIYSSLHLDHFHLDRI